MRTSAPAEQTWRLARPVGSRTSARSTPTREPRRAPPRASRAAPRRRRLHAPGRPAPLRGAAGRRRADQRGGRRLLEAGDRRRVFTHSSGPAPEVVVHVPRRRRAVRRHGARSLRGRAGVRRAPRPRHPLAPATGTGSTFVRCCSATRPRSRRPPRRSSGRACSCRHLHRRVCARPAAAVLGREADGPGRPQHGREHGRLPRRHDVVRATASASWSSAARSSTGSPAARSRWP